MTIAYLCVLIAAVLPYVLVGYAKFSTRGYDNSSPREFLERMEGKAKRANYAQLNSFEAFPAFAASVIIANIAGVPAFQISVLACCFVAFRIVYNFLYIFDKPAWRTLIWSCGFLCVISLFVLAIRHSA